MTQRTQVRETFGMPWYGRLWGLLVSSVGVVLAFILPHPWATDGVAFFPEAGAVRLELREHHWLQGPEELTEALRGVVRADPVFVPGPKGGGRWALALRGARTQLVLRVSDPDRASVARISYQIAQCLDAGRPACAPVRFRTGQMSPPLLPLSALLGLAGLLAGLGLLLAPGTTLALCDGHLVVRRRWPWPRTAQHTRHPVTVGSRLVQEDGRRGTLRLVHVAPDGTRTRLVETANTPAILRLLDAWTEALADLSPSAKP